MHVYYNTGSQKDRQGSKGFINNDCGGERSCRMYIIILETKRTVREVREVKNLWRGGEWLNLYCNVGSQKNRQGGKESNEPVEGRRVAERIL